jgi:hypothetical protein
MTVLTWELRGTSTINRNISNENICLDHGVNTIKLIGRILLGTPEVQKDDMGVIESHLCRDSLILVCLSAATTRTQYTK